MSLSLLPKTNAADERLTVVAPLSIRRQFIHFSDITAAENDIIRLERSPQDFDNVGHVPAPLFQSRATQPASAEIVFKASSFFVWQVSEFHWLNHAVDDHG